MISVGFSPGGNFASLLYASEFKIFRLCPFQLFAKFERVYAKAISLSVQADWIALIGSGDDLEFSPRCIRLFNACENSEVTFIAEIAFSEAVMNVFLRDRMFFVCTESKVYGFEREYMQKTMSIDVLSGAYDSICISMNGLLAIPCSDFKGELEIYDAGKASGQKISRIEAHESRIACCLFSEDSKKIATCSEKGTIIRVFSVPNGEKLYSFRRGLQHAKNLSLGFNFDSTFLCCSSARNTIHIYSLEKEKTDRKTSFSSLLNSATQNLFDLSSSTLEVHILEVSSGMIQEISFNGNDSLFVITNSGNFYHYQFNRQSKTLQLVGERSLCMFSQEFCTELKLDS